VLKILNVIGAYDYAGATLAFCQQHHVRPKAMQEISKLRSQLVRLCQLHLDVPDLTVDPNLAPPTKQQCKLLCQVLLAGFADQVAIRQDLVDTCIQRPKSIRQTTYMTMWHTEPTFIHPSSIVYYQAGPAPDMLVYNELVHTSKPYLKCVTAIDRAWLPQVASKLCTFGKPLDQPAPKYNDTRTEARVWVQPTFGPKSWPLPLVQITQKKQGSTWVYVQ
jgi:ATP-dependent RNA helicase DHX37/DHR1